MKPVAGCELLLSDAVMLCNQQGLDNSRHGQWRHEWCDE
jgi:hypothetical protein